ncbi:hypothetical protein [Pseudomonas sp. GL-B-19]|uniref:hypothetical protein n=1 Tax=Pseudomonas sp. GL-B-19 TaxID=2832393 RepID=UPI001CBB5E98|nr:hypothetical protein [Pseudomonas sp. GL-B-19]
MQPHSSNPLSNVCRTLFFTALFAGVLALNGCATVEAQTTQYVGVPQYPPTIPAEVQVLRTDPTRPFVRLGEILIDASIEPAPPMAEIELKLQDEGAKLGADAVVVVYDQIATVGAYVSGPVWARDVNTIQGRKLKAIAIKYK